MNRFVAITTALLVGLAPAAAVAGGNQYFTWENAAGIEQGPVAPGATQTFVLRVAEDGSPTLPTGYVVQSWYWGGLPGAPCDTNKPLATSQSSVTLTFPEQLGGYEVCLRLVYSEDPEDPFNEPIWDAGWVTVQENRPPWIGNIQFEPPLPVVGYAVQASARVTTDIDTVASCTVDYGDGTDPVEGTIQYLQIFSIPGGETQIICQGPAHTYELAGTYPVSFTATDAGGLTGYSEPENVTPLAEPYMYVDYVGYSFAAIKSGRLWNYAGEVNIHDFLGSDVTRATVTAEWRRDGIPFLTQTFRTDRNGIAKFALRAFPFGYYSLCVTNVEKPGFTFWFEAEWQLCSYGGGGD